MAKSISGKRTSPAASPRRPAKTAPPRAKARAKIREKTPDRRAGADTGCVFVPEWRMLTSTAGMTRVWISTKEYDRIATAFATLTKSPATGARLRARRQSIGVTHKCSGTCVGGFCGESEVPQPDLSLVTVCECKYFV